MNKLFNKILTPFNMVFNVQSSILTLCQFIFNIYYEDYLFNNQYLYIMFALLKINELEVYSWEVNVHNVYSTLTRIAIFVGILLTIFVYYTMFALTINQLKIYPICLGRKCIYITAYLLLVAYYLIPMEINLILCYILYDL